MKTVSAKNRVSYYIRYTLLFIVTALVIYAPFLVMKKSFVWEHDSYTQHLKAMVYISRWYRQTRHCSTEISRRSPPIPSRSDTAPTR